MINNIYIKKKNIKIIKEKQKRNKHNKIICLKQDKNKKEINENMCICYTRRPEVGELRCQDGEWDRLDLCKAYV